MEDLRVFELDLHQANPDNKVFDETQPGEEGQNWFRLDYSPFYADSLTVYNGIGQLLRTDEYRLEGYDEKLSLLTGSPIYNFVVIKEGLDFHKAITTDYHSIGECSTPISRMAKIVDDLLHNKNPVDFETQVVGKPETYPVLDHAHSAHELTGWEYFIQDAIKASAFYKDRTQTHWFTNQTYIVDLALKLTARRWAYLTKLHAHDESHANDHHLTKFDLELGLIQNHALSTVEQDVEGVGRNTFSTPAGLGEVIKKNRYYPPVNVRPGLTGYNQYFTPEHTQFLTNDPSDLDIVSLGGYWAPTLNGGVAILSNYENDDDKVTSRYTNYHPAKGITYPLTTLTPNLGFGTFNTPDGSVLGVLNSKGLWAITVRDTGLVYSLEKASIPKRADVYRQIVVGIKDHVFYMVGFYYDDDSETPLVEIHYTSLVGKPNNAQLRLQRATITFTHEDETTDDPNDFVSVFKVVKEQSGNITRIGRLMPPDSVTRVIKGCLMLVNFETVGTDIPIKVIQPIEVSIDGVIYDTALEQCLSVKTDTWKGKTEYEATRRLNIPLTLEELSGYKDDNTDNVYSTLKALVNNPEVGTSIGLLRAQTCLALGDISACSLITIPYTRAVEAVSRPWIPYLDNSSFTPIEAEFDYDPPEDSFSLVAPAVSECYLDGMKLLVDDDVLDVRAAYRKYKTKTLGVYLCIRQTYAKYVFHSDLTLTRPGLMLTYTLTVDPVKGITSITPVKG